jgi:hypothetical protein
MTSPVDFISGPSSASSPGKRANGSTGFLIETNVGVGAFVTPSSPSVLPTAASAARRASGQPIALATNGTVREARGLASRM